MLFDERSKIFIRRKLLLKYNIGFNLFPKCYFLFDLEGNASKTMISSTICLKHCHHFL